MLNNATLVANKLQKSKYCINILNLTNIIFYIV